MMISSCKTVKNWLENLVKIRKNSDSPQLDAQLLLMFTCNRTRAWVMAHADAVLSAAEEREINEYLDDFQEGVPMAYILKEQEFWSLPLAVSPATLIPRPATESLVEWVLETLPVKPALTLLDLGTGSGALALAIKSERPNWAITATDQSADALTIAAKNAGQLKLEIEFIQGSWWKPVLNKSFDCIVCNPPYIADNDLHLARLQHEPIGALASGPNGLDDLSVIAQDVYDHLNAGGWFVVEHGYNQQSAVMNLLSAAGLTAVNGYQDLSGQDRFVVGQRRS